MAKFISNSLEETEKIAKNFVNSLSLGDTSGATIIGLYGDLGAGKTTFAQMIAKILSISGIITSPTFVIMKIYNISYVDVKHVKHRVFNKVVRNSHFNHLVHIDAYRIEQSEELIHLGWKEIISDPKNLILIEWPERVPDIMPEHIKINLKTLENENSRSIDIII